MADRRNIIVTIEERLMTLGPGRTFVRNRCPACRCYWDNQHSYQWEHEEETEFHAEGCPVAGSVRIPEPAPDDTLTGCNRS